VIYGSKESARFNKVITLFNVTLILFIIVLGACYIETTNYTPFFPSGLKGVITGTHSQQPFGSFSPNRYIIG
jgi:APA family basic amino acid/polyamine antiporter